MQSKPGLASPASRHVIIEFCFRGAIGASLGEAACRLLVIISSPPSVHRICSCPIICVASAALVRLWCSLNTRWPSPSIGVIAWTLPPRAAMTSTIRLQLQLRRCQLFSSDAVVDVINTAFRLPYRLDSPAAYGDDIDDSAAP